MSLMDNLSKELGKDRLPPVHVGDTVQVHYLIKEGDKERIQVFTGTVLAIQGRGVARTIVVRRIVQGEGVERIFPMHSPRVQDVRITRRGKVRRARLYYLRDRVGKQTRVGELVGEKVRRERDLERQRRADAGAAENADEGEERPVDSEEASEEAVEVS